MMLLRMNGDFSRGIINVSASGKALERLKRVLTVAGYRKFAVECTPYGALAVDDVCHTRRNQPKPLLSAI